MKTEEQIMKEFIRTKTIADKSYLRGLLFCLGRNDLRVMTDEHINEIAKEFKNKSQSFNIKIKKNNNYKGETRI